MKKIIVLVSLVCSLPFAYAAPQTSTLEQHQAELGFLLAQEIVEAGRYFNQLYGHCPTNLESIGLENISALTAHLLASATINKHCQVTVRYAQKSPVATALQGKTITIKPSSKALERLVGECSFDGPPELAPPNNCKSQTFPHLTREDTQIIDGFVMAYRNYNPALIKADALNELFSLMLLPKMMVMEYYDKQQRCPTDNQQAGLSAPAELSVRFLKGVSIAGCEVTATYKDSAPVPNHFRNKTVTYTLHVTADKQQPKNNQLSWLCHSDLASDDLPKDCQPK